MHSPLLRISSLSHEVQSLLVGPSQVTQLVSQGWQAPSVPRYSPSTQAVQSLGPGPLQVRQEPSHEGQSEAA